MIEKKPLYREDIGLHDKLPLKIGWASIWLNALEYHGNFNDARCISLPWTSDDFDYLVNNPEVLEEKAQDVFYVDAPEFERIATLGDLKNLLAGMVEMEPDCASAEFGYQVLHGGFACLRHLHSLTLLEANDGTFYLILLGEPSYN